MTPLSAIYVLWDIWIVSWMLAAIWSTATLARPRAGAETAYRVFVIAGGAVLFFYSSPYEPGPSWPVPDLIGWTMAAIALMGFSFSWWARLHLGRLWSSSVTKKIEHRVIDTGPYRLVRHPIYTGIIFASYATAIAKGTLLALAGASVMLVGWYVKARVEERFLSAELNRGDYDAYASRVPMLLPLAPR